MEVWGQVWAALAPRVLFRYVVTWPSWTWTYNRLRWVLKSMSEKIRERDLHAKASLNQLQIFCTILEAMPGGGPMSPVWILKCLVSVFINACRLLSALPSLLQFGRGRLSRCDFILRAVATFCSRQLSCTWSQINREKSWACLSYKTFFIFQITETGYCFVFKASAFTCINQFPIYWK